MISYLFSHKGPFVMALNLRSIEDSVLLLEWRYFVSGVVICMIIYIAIALFVGGTKSIPFSVLGIFSLLLTHLFLLAWWHWTLRKDRQDHCYMGDRYIAPKPFIREGHGDSFITLKPGVLAQVVFIYMFISLLVTSLVAIVHGQLIN